jgi:plastocyanin
MSRSAAGVLAVAALVAACAGEPVPTPAAPDGMIEIRLVAQGIAFAPPEVGAPSGTPLRLVLDNRDPGVPHNVALTVGDVTLAETEIVPGPDEAEVEVPGLPPGRYQLVCLVHPTMVTILGVSS